MNPPRPRNVELKSGGRSSWKMVSLLLFCSLVLSVHGQYYDSTARTSAEDYLQQVTNTVGEANLNNYPRSRALYLAGTLGQLDRMTVLPEVFLEHLDEAEKMRNRFYDEIPEESFREYVLGIRIRSEFTSRAGWRRRLCEELKPLIGTEKDINKAAEIIFSSIFSKVKLTGDTRTYALNLKGDLDPLTTLRGHRGSEIDVAILTIACLRSVGIAARVVYAPVIANENGGKVWIEYRDRKEWQPWVPTAPSHVNGKKWLAQEFAGKLAYILANPQQPTNITNRYVPTAPLWLSPLPLSHEKFDGGPMILSNGRLQSVMGRDVYNTEPTDSALGVGVGAYIIASGDLSNLVGMKPVILHADDPGWYQMNFETKKQMFASGKERPAFFEWAPDPAENNPAW